MMAGPQQTSAEFFAEVDADLKAQQREVELRAKRAQAIMAAGFPATRHEDVLAALSGIFEVHSVIATTPGYSATEVQAVITAAEHAGLTDGWDKKLLSRLYALPVGARVAIFGYVGRFRGGELRPANRLRVDELIARATAVHNANRRGRGAPATNLTGLLAELAMLWHREMPGHVGIAKSGARADLKGSEYEYAGPLLELVVALLDAEGIAHTSRYNVGRQLWKFSNA